MAQHVDERNRLFSTAMETAKIASSCMLPQTRTALTVAALAVFLIEFTQAQAGKSCPVNADEQNADQHISIAEVAFSGSLQMPPSEQQQIATSIKERVHGDRLEAVVDLASELAREGWQDHGYFMAQVGGDAKTLTSNAIGQRVVLDLHVDEGRQYRVGEITLKHNKAIKEEVVRAFFPTRRGEIFSRKEMAAGLENLRKAYDELGYTNFVSIPTPTVDDQSQSVSFEIEIDEGRQFHFTSLNLVGFDEDSRQRLLSDFPAGQIYDVKLFTQFVEKHSSIFNFSPDDPWHSEYRFDDRTGDVAITLDARLCVQ
jgi:hypothetical protein